MCFAPMLVLGIPKNKGATNMNEPRYSELVMIEMAGVTVHVQLEKGDNAPSMHHDGWYIGTLWLKAPSGDRWGRLEYKGTFGGRKSYNYIQEAK